MGFDALGGVDKQDGTLTRLEGAGDLVGKVHVARGIDHLEDDLLPFVRTGLGYPGQAYVLRLNGDTAFAFDVHIIEELVTHIALRNHLG